MIILQLYISKTMKKYLLLFILLNLPLFAQKTDDLIDMINIKLEKDKKYLNIHSIPMYLDKNKNAEILTLPRTDGKIPFEFKLSDNFTYRLVFIKTGIELDSLIILYVNEIKDNSNSAGDEFMTSAVVNDDTNMVVTFKDLFFLKKGNKDKYQHLYSYLTNYLLQNDEESITGLLQIRPDEKLNRSFGFSSRDNRDFLRYMITNSSSHWYPRKEEEITSSGRIKKVEKLPFQVDATLYSLSFAHNIMGFGAQNDRGGASLELDVYEPLLNLLPIEAMTLNGGFRAVFLLEKADTREESSYIDAKFQVRANMARRSFMDGDYIFKNNPFAFVDQGRLNMNTGLLGDIEVTRPFTLPNLRIYLSVMGDDFSDANIYLTGNPSINNGGLYAYYSISQFFTTMSFYWNIDETVEHSFRFDLGTGYYDIWLANYAGWANFRDSKLIKDGFQPLLTIGYTFAPDENPFINLKLKYYDSRITIDSWLRVFKTKDMVHEFRFYANYITPPIARDTYDWETQGGLSLNLGYRYGL